MRLPGAGSAVGLALVLGGLAACGGDDTAAPEPAPATTTTAAATTVTGSATVVDWTTAGLDVDIGDGFRARHCEGDAPLLCIERAGIPVGVLELLDFPAGEPPQSLEDRITDFYRTFTADRTQGCPPGYRFEGVAPEAAAVAGGEGLRYGFTGTFADGRPSEYTLAWMTRRGDVVTVLSAAADELDGCLPPEGAGHFTTATLEAAAAGLGRLVAGSRLPEPTTF
ncbi:MAG: hypothetical protein ACRDZ7_02985 [Acidimicrobiia bacterium]